MNDIRILYLEDDGDAGLFVKTLIGKGYLCDWVTTPFDAYGCLEEDGSYDAIIIDADLGIKAALQLQDEEEYKVELDNGMFSGYIVYSNIICKHFSQLRDKTCFYTAHFNMFRESLGENSEAYLSISNRVFNKKTELAETKILSWLKNVLV